MRILPAAIVALLAAGCGSSPAVVPGPGPDPDPDPPPGPTPVATMPPAGAVRVEWTTELPPVGGWSEGLDVYDGVLWQAFPGTIVARDAKTGEEIDRWDPPSTYSESLAWLDGTLFNVSYHDANIYAGSLEAGDLAFDVAGVTPHEHAWGITHDGRRLVLTGNGQPYLYFLDETLELERVLETPVDDLEDLAWHASSVFASSYSEHPGSFFRVDPATGAVLERFEVPEPEACSIVDGLAIDEEGTIWVTGKDCPAVWIGRVVIAE